MIFLLLLIWLLLGLFNCYIIGRHDGDGDMGPICIAAVVFSPIAFVVVLSFLAYSLGERHR